jgi:exocyst complex protein 7
VVLIEHIKSRTPKQKQQQSTAAKTKTNRATRAQVKMPYSRLIVDIDEADAVVLQESLNKSRSLISQISQSLSKITTSTTKSGRLLHPIVERNRQLALFKRNVDDSLLAVSNVQGIASEAAMFESKLSGRIDNVKQYITTIHKAEDIVERLEQGSEAEYKGIYENLRRTITDSEIKLQLLFRELLKPVSQTFDPMIYMNDRKPFPYLEDNHMKDLGRIADYFTETGNSIDQLYVDNRSKVIRESMVFLVPFTEHISKNEKVPYEKGSNGINQYTDALLGFMSNEHALLEDVYKDEQLVLKLFQKIFSPIFDAYIQIINKILNKIQVNIPNFGLLTFELIDNSKNLQSTIEAMTFEEYPELNKSLELCRALARTLFKELLVYTDQRVTRLQSLPQDNGVSEATVDIMSKARKFAEFRDGALEVMRGLKAGSWIPQPKPRWLTKFSSVTSSVDDDEPLELLSSFFSDIIDALIVSLEIKASELIKKKQSIGYLLITNITLVEQIISRSLLKDILNTTGMQRLEKLKSRALNMFLIGWKQVASYLLDVNVVGKLSSKDRDAIKQKFTNFNTEFDDLLKSYKQYNITDPALKKYLSKEIGFIVPLYHRFYDKHSRGDFTKNLGKYIKYDKMEFDRIIDSLGR